MTRSVRSAAEEDRQVLDCASPLALFWVSATRRATIARTSSSWVEKRQRAAALHDA